MWLLQDLFACCSKILTPCNKQQEAFWACSAVGVALYTSETLELMVIAAFYQMGHTCLHLNRRLSLWVGSRALSHPWIRALVWICNVILTIGRCCRVSSLSPTFAQKSFIVGQDLALCCRFFPAPSPIFLHFFGKFSPLKVLLNQHLSAQECQHWLQWVAWKNVFISISFFMWTIRMDNVAGLNNTYSSKWQTL